MPYFIIFSKEGSQNAILLYIKWAKAEYAFSKLAAILEAKMEYPTWKILNI
jgi:hypothetical protein